MKHFLSAIFLLFSLSANAVSTVIPDMKFRRLDTRDGLSNSQINYLFQDSKGIIWMGTSYGLNRYDGYRFRTFYSDPNDTTTLRNNYVDLIWEDHKGRLWMRQGMNFSIFDPVTEHVNRNPSTELAKMGIKGGVDRFFIDSEKRFWVKTYDEGMYCYNPKTEKLTLIKYGYGDNEIPKEFWLSSFGDCGDKVLIISSNGVIMALDGDKGKVVWKDSFVKDNGGEPDQAYNIYMDGYENIWVISTHLFVYDQKAKRWHSSVNSFFSSMGIPPLPDPLQIWDVCMDRRGWYWIVTDHEGLFVIDPKSKEVKQFLNNKFDTTSLSENTAKHLLLDKNGSMVSRHWSWAISIRRQRIRRATIGWVPTTVVSSNTIPRRATRRSTTRPDVALPQILWWHHAQPRMVPFGLVPIMVA